MNQNKRILVVDDVETNLIVAEAFFSAYVSEIDLAANGEEAIAKAVACDPYDIVFMDHRMPGIDGVEAVRILRAKGYTHPIVALTASMNNNDEIRMFLDNGFDAVAAKPVNAEAIDPLMRQFLSSAPAADTAPKSAFGALLAESFVRDAVKAMEILTPMFSDSESGSEFDIAYLAPYVDCLHGVKSALCNIRRTDLAQVASRLEYAGQSINLGYIRAETPGFLTELARVVATLSPEAADDDTRDDPAFFREHLQTLCDACDIYDIDHIRETLNTLNTTMRNAQNKTTVTAIADRILNGDFEAAGALARDTLSLLQGEV